MRISPALFDASANINPSQTVSPPVIFRFNIALGVWWFMHQLRGVKPTVIHMHFVVQLVHWEWHHFYLFLT